MITVEQKQAIEQAWRDRVEAQGLKGAPIPPDGRGSVTYRKAEVEFFAGVMAALQVLHPNTTEPGLMSNAIPAGWVLHALSGRPIVDMGPKRDDGGTAANAANAAMAQSVQP
jgi:hypothetical protein